MSETDLQALSADEQVRLQGQFIQSAEMDEAFRDAGGRILWAVDTNIVRFIVDPLAAAYPLTGAQQTGFAAIFQQDPPELVSVLADAIVDHITTNLSIDAPLLVLAPLDKQVVAYIGQLSREGAEAADKALTLNNSVQDLLDGFRHETDEPSKDEIAVKLLQLTLVRRRSTQLAKLKDLFEKNRLSFLAVAKDALPEKVFLAISPPEVDDKYFLRCMIEDSQWRDFLGRLIPGRKGKRSFAQKAAALSELRRINRRLDGSGQQGNLAGRLRINFLTGDTPLTTDLDRVNLRANPEVSAELLEFCRTHFRHPRSLFSDIGILQVGDGDDHDIGHFFDLWAHWGPGASDGEGNGLAEKMQANWAEFLKKAILKFDVTIEKSELEDWQVETAEAFAAWQEENRDRIEEDVARFWEQCFYFATQGLVRFGDAGSIKKSSRNVPPIYLESWSGTYGMINLLVNWQSPADFDLERYQQGLQQLDHDFLNETGSSRGRRYAYYLAHAVLFASRGDWSIAAKVAAFSRQFARRDAAAPGEANGREAAYIEAFCLRHAALSEQDLSELPELVESARSIAKAEVAASQSKSGRSHDCVELRFDCEINAIEVTRWLFRRFRSPEPVNDDLEEEAGRLSEIILKSRDLYDRICVSIAAIENKVEADPEAAKRFSVLFRLRVRVLVNLLGLSLYSRARVFDRELQRFLLSEAGIVESVFGSGRSGLGGRCFSEFGVLMLNCVTSIASESGSARRDSQLAVAQTLKARDGELNLATFPYDRGPSGRLNWIKSVALDYFE